MKKITFLTSVLTAMVSVSAMSQGYFNGFNNQTPGGLIRAVDPRFNGGAATLIGTAANTAGFTGLGPASVTVDLFLFAGSVDFSDISSVRALLPGGANATTPFATFTQSASSLTTAQGTFANANIVNNPLTLPTGAAFNGPVVTLVYYAENALDTYDGFAVAHLAPAVAGSGAKAPTVFGTDPGMISSFVLNPIPEPTTLALGGIGAAALLLFRRRK